MRGLEIGPLYRPRVRRSDGPVRYVDHCTAEELRETYKWNKDVSRHLDEIVDIDYVVGPGAPLPEVVAQDGPFDYLIASHVIEHLANPLGWLAQAAQVLDDKGLVSVVVPDKRYCFDLNRDKTRDQDWVGWYLDDLKQPTFSQVFDFYAHAVTIDGAVDTAAIWAGTADYTEARRPDVPDADLAGYDTCLELQQSGRYMDVHTGVYTPQRLLELLGLGTKLGIISYEVAHLEPTPYGSLEFYLTLRKCSPDERQKALSSFDEALASLSREPAVASVQRLPNQNKVRAGCDSAQGTGREDTLVVSSRERKLIEAKRSLLLILRKAKSRYG